MTSFRSSACSVRSAASPWVSWVGCFKRKAGAAHLACACARADRPRRPRGPRRRVGSRPVRPAGPAGRLEDNAPVRDAEVALVLRGATHPATALPDGGYAVVTPDLALPGAAAVRIEVTSSGTRQDLAGTLQPTAAAAATEDKGTSRQLGWWVLNFAVCIGFLWLWQRRKRHAPDEGAPDSRAALSVSP